MKNNFKYLIVIICSLVILLSVEVVLAYFSATKEEKKVYEKPEKIEVKEKNLMIVAHPDDETFWGANELIENDYLVVCITCGCVDKRVKEFKKVMAKTHDEYIMLGYPDVTNKKKDNWKTSYDKIAKDLEDIINSKDWDKILTHNPEGEYGHIHHKMTNKIVTGLAPKDNLYYFGKYYKPCNLKDAELTSISEENYNYKMTELVTEYKSQKKAYDLFKHMFKYEKTISYSEWYDS